MHDSPFLDTRGAALFLGTDAEGEPIISPKTLEKWRREGRGPAYSKLGRRCMYTRDGLLEFAQRQLRTSTSQGGPWASARP